MSSAKPPSCASCGSSELFEGVCIECCATHPQPAAFSSSASEQSQEHGGSANTEMVRLTHPLPSNDDEAGIPTASLNLPGDNQGGLVGYSVSVGLENTSSQMQSTIEALTPQEMAFFKSDELGAVPTCCSEDEGAPLCANCCCTTWNEQIQARLVYREGQASTELRTHAIKMASGNTRNPLLSGTSNDPLVLKLKPSAAQLNCMRCGAFANSASCYLPFFWCVTIPCYPLCYIPHCLLATHAAGQHSLELRDNRYDDTLAERVY